MASKHTTLYLRIAEAKNLLPKDLNGKSDPYCVIKVDNEIISRTATVYKNLEPLWGEEFTLHMPFGFQDLSVNIYDEDRVSGDDIIGTVSITREVIQRLSDPRGLENWFPLQKPDKDWEIQGEILLEYGIRPSTSEPGLYQFYITVIEGRDLAPKDKTGYSDPYVTVACLGDLKTTSRQKKTRFPEWNEIFEFDLPSIYDGEMVVITVYDKDRLGADDFMGQIHLPLSQIPHNSTKKWHPVAHKTENKNTTSERRGSKVDRGKIRLKIFLLEEIVLPVTCYQPIIDYLLQAAKPYKHKKIGVPFWMLLNDVRRLDLSETGAALVRFYLSQDSDISFLDCITKQDIDETDDPNTLFRGNSLATKAMDQYMKIIGMPYLHETLNSCIEKVYSDKKTVELDPHRVNSVRRIALYNSLRHSLHKESESDFIQSSQDILLSYMIEIMEAIYTSVDDCPLKMRLVFRNLTQRVKEKWPETEHKDSPYQAVIGFIFLRFFAPAILSPKLFGLQDHHPNRKTSRTLTLLAKLTQLIGNLTSFQVKEEWFQPLVPIMKSHVPRIKHYIDSLVSVVTPDKYTEGVSTGRSLTEKENSIILRQGVLHKCRYHPKRLLRSFVFKKRSFWLTRNSLHYSKISTDDSVRRSKYLDVTMICAVEKLDYGALGKSNIGQIILKTPEGDQDILYFQAKDVNELTSWISTLRKTCHYNKYLVPYYHPGVYKNDKWSCCHKTKSTAPGCNQTYHGVIIGDWQDSLDTAREAQIILSQFSQSLDKLREKEKYLETHTSSNGKTGSVSPQSQLEVLRNVITIVNTIQKDHDHYQQGEETL
ncbi:hypothetical protein SNE40_003776 [Patella caerulea]|uniref:Uncharacterized protein n=1 Tax=Patella caerulea TaxID=87958 RepID=A0AAN8KHD4_PATCE